MYDKLVAKVNNIDTSGFALKTKYDTDKSDLEKTIPDISRLVKKTDYNAKNIELESKIPSISGLATNAALTAVDISNFIKKNENKKKTDYNAKISEIENKYITTADYNKFTKNIFDNRTKSKNLADKPAISGFIKMLI